MLSVVALLSFLLDPALSPVIVRRLAQEPGSVPTPAATEGLRVVLGLVALVLVVAATVALRGLHALPLAAALGGQILPRALVLNATPWLQADHRLHRQTAWEAVTAAVGLAALVVAAALDASPAVLAPRRLHGPDGVPGARHAPRDPPGALEPPAAAGRPVGPPARRSLVEVGPLAAALTLTAVYSRVYTIFVNAAEDAAGVAQFLFAYLFVEQILVVSGIFAAALLPLLAVRARATRLFADRLTHELFVATAALGAIGAGALIALAPLLCRLIGGPNLAPADRYLELLAPMAAIVPVAFFLGYLHMAVGLGRRYLRINVVALGGEPGGQRDLHAEPRRGGDGARVVGDRGARGRAELLGAVADGRVGHAAGVRMAVVLVVVVAGAELAGADVLVPARRASRSRSRPSPSAGGACSTSGASCAGGLRPSARQQDDRGRRDRHPDEDERAEEPHRATRGSRR